MQITESFFNGTGHITQIQDVLNLQKINHEVQVEHLFEDF